MNKIMIVIGIIILIDIYMHREIKKFLDHICDLIATTYVEDQNKRVYCISMNKLLIKINFYNSIVISFEILLIIVIIIRTISNIIS